MIRRAIIIFLCEFGTKNVYFHILWWIFYSMTLEEIPPRMCHSSRCLFYIIYYTTFCLHYFHTISGVSQTHTHKLTPKCSKMKNKQILQWMQIFLSICRVVSYKKAKVWKWNENESTFHVNTVRQFQLFLFTW